jgi:hypothetical protein
VLFISNSMAMPARMDINQPAPSVQLSAQRVEQLNPQQAPALHPIQAHGAQLQQQ